MSIKTFVQVTRRKITLNTFNIFLILLSCLDNMMYGSSIKVALSKTEFVSKLAEAYLVRFTYIYAAELSSLSIHSQVIITLLFSFLAPIQIRCVWVQ